MDLKQDAGAARGNAQDAFNFAQDARNRSDRVAKALSDVNEKIIMVLNEDQPTPMMVRDLAEEVLNKNIHLRPDEIRELADKIDSIIISLTDSDKILTDTAGDLRMAQELEQRANNAKLSAIEKQNQAGKVEII